MYTLHTINFPVVTGRVLHRFLITGPLTKIPLPPPYTCPMKRDGGNLPQPIFLLLLVTLSVLGSVALQQLAPGPRMNMKWVLVPVFSLRSQFGMRLQTINQSIKQSEQKSRYCVQPYQTQTCQTNDADIATQNYWDICFPIHASRLGVYIQSAVFLPSTTKVVCECYPVRLPVQAEIFFIYRNTQKKKKNLFIYSFKIDSKGTTTFLSKAWKLQGT